MSKSTQESVVVMDQEKACEIIELATEDLFTLADAFRLIADVCEDRDAPTDLTETLPLRSEIH